MADRLSFDRAALSKSATSRVTAGRRAQDTVFVELGEAVQKAQIARDGVQVPVLDLDADILGEVIAGKPKVVTKVVSQSIQPGASVPKGTVVDIVLAEPRRLPTRIIKDVHEGLHHHEIGQVFDQFLRDNAAVRGVIARNERPETLSSADQAVIRTAFEQADLTVSTEPGRTMNEAFKTLQAAFTFGF